MAGLVLVLIAVLGIGGFPAGASGAVTPRKIVLAYAAMNARVAALWVARERGFFVKNGFDADPLFVRGAPTLVAAMTSGEIDVGYTGGTAVVGAVAAGADFKILSALNNRVTYELVVRPGLGRPQGPREQTVRDSGYWRHGVDGRIARLGASWARSGPRQDPSCRRG